MTSGDEFRNGKEVSLMRNRSLAIIGMLLVPIAVALWGCSNGGVGGTLIDNERPTVELSNALGQSVNVGQPSVAWLGSSVWPLARLSSSTEESASGLSKPKPNRSLRPSAPW